LRKGLEDVQLAGRINRIRQFYFEAAPQVARYLSPPSQDSPAAIARQAGVSSPSWYQFLTIAGALAVVNSVLIGGVIGLAVQAGAGGAGGVGGSRGDHRWRGAGRAFPAAAGDLAGRRAAGRGGTRAGGSLKLSHPGAAVGERGASVAWPALTSCQPTPLAPHADRLRRVLNRPWHRSHNGPSGRAGSKTPPAAGPPVTAARGRLCRRAR